MDQSGKWYSLDRMATGNVNKASGLTHTHRGVTDEGWFFLETGGWAFRKPPTTSTISLPSKTARPAYLTDQDISDLNSTPSSIEFDEPIQPKNHRTISFTVRNAGTNPMTTLYYGTKEGLTFADQWQHKVRLPEISNGPNQIALPRVDHQDKLLLRLQLTNDEGIFWSGNTLRLNQ